MPATASTQCRVSVAMPDRWPIRFSAVRSAVSSARVGPVTREHGFPGRGGGRRRPRAASTRPRPGRPGRRPQRRPGSRRACRRPRDDVAGGLRVGGRRSRRGDVGAEGEVLLQRAAHHALDLGGVAARRRQRGGVVAVHRAAGAPVMPRPASDGRARCGCCSRPASSSRCTRRTCHSGRARGASVRRWQPRLSVRAAAAAASSVAAVCRAVVSTAARSSGRPSSAGDGGEHAGQSGQPVGVAEDAGVAGGADVIAVRARRVDRRAAGAGTGSASAGRSTASSAAQRRAATRPSVMELDASRLAPWTPVHATSPTAKRPATLVRPSRSATTPPQE